MTINIFLLISAFIGIALVVKSKSKPEDEIDFDNYRLFHHRYLHSSKDDDWEIVGYSVSLISIALLLMHLVFYLPSKTDSEIIFEQLVQEKTSIEEMLAVDKDIDRLMLNKRVISYNNRVIRRKVNSKRIIYRDYYSKDVDWNDLKPIEWK